MGVERVGVWSSMCGVERSCGVFRNGELRLSMLNGVLDWVVDGALSNPLKSRGVSLLFWGPFLEGGRAGLGSGFPNMPSSSLAELEFVEPSGEMVGGGELRLDEHGEPVVDVAGEDKMESVEMLVLGERVTVLLSLQSNGKIDTPSSRVAPDDRIGLKVLFLLFAK